VPGTPPTTPVHGAPRVSNSDTFDMARDVNGVADRFDITAMRLDTGLASARPGTGPGTGAWYYATDTRTLSRWNGSAWETNLPNAHAATHQDGGTDPLTVREAMMATGALGPAKGSFSAYRNAALSLTTGSTVIFDTDSGTDGWDLSNWYDTTTGRFTPQVAGYYRFSWMVASGNVLTVGNYWRADLYKNGAIHKTAMPCWQVNGNLAAVWSGASDLAVANGTTDFFTIVLTHNQGVASSVGNTVYNTFFQGHLIGRS
jgi:hypothetical protein